MKIYTKTGDTGETGLLGGKRVKKSCIEMDGIGEIDELNGAIGVLLALLNESQYKIVRKQLSCVQDKLFVIGSNLAAVQSELNKVPELVESDINDLEKWIDEMEYQLVPLRNFILPGGNLAAAQSFLARAVCRRGERRVVDLIQKYSNLNPNIQKYLNRLSDFLFVLARWINWMNKIEEKIWQG